MYFSQNSGVVEFIIKRIQERVKSMQKTRLIFINTMTLEELRQNKSIMIKQFLEIEDDLKQSVQALTTLLIQNKDLAEEKDRNDSFLRGYELRIVSLEKNFGELNLKYENLIQENENLEKKMIDNEKVIIEQNKQINNFDLMLEEKQKYNRYLENEVFNLNCKIQEKESVIRNIQTIKRSSPKNNYDYENREKKFNEHIYTPKLEKNSSEKNVLNHTFNHDQENTQQDNLNKLDEDNNYNVNNYLNERQNKKKLINDMIKEHLEQNNNEEEKSNLLLR
jgi:hypothetical protein